MGSPDPHGRQLGGMGGGISALSKVCVIGPSQREDAGRNATRGSSYRTARRLFERYVYA